MIQLVEQGLESNPQVSEVHHPAGVFPDFAADMYLDPKRMAVNSRTFVPLRHIREVVRSLDLEHAKNVHCRIVPLTRSQCNKRALLTRGHRDCAGLGFTFVRRLCLPQQKSGEVFARAVVASGSVKHEMRA